MWSKVLPMAYPICITIVLHRSFIVTYQPTSNNIILDSNLEAVVSDFGTARLLDLDSSNQTLVAGTYG